MNWAQKRKLTYVLIILGFFGIIAFAVIHKVTSVTPTCFDRKMNGDEKGVDCGGGCSVYCSNELSDPTVQWVRVFPVTDGIVHAVVYIQHGYPVSAARTVGYEFKLYDDQNNLIADRKGTTFLGTAGTSAIVETLIPVAHGTVSLARFSFNDPVAWEKVSPTFSQVVIDTSRTTIEAFNTGRTSVPSTRLIATLQNKSRYNFTNVDVVAIFYDKEGNAITSSKVLLPSLPALQSKPVYFTWPYPVVGVARTEIIPRFNPFTAQSI
ncbi:MAG: hypothetical protein ABIO57_00665 [Candidatus Paceibacterota bacterium]